MPKIVRRFTRSPLGQRMPHLVAWIDRWGPYIAAAACVVCFVASIVSATALAIGLAAKDDVADSASLSCNRSRAFGPYVATDYERRHVMPAEKLRAYRRTIPRTCP